MSLHNLQSIDDKTENGRQSLDIPPRAIVEDSHGLPGSEEEEEEDGDEFYTPGTSLLYETRLELLRDSLKSAADRTNDSRSKLKTQDFVKTLKHRRSIQVKLATYNAFGSQLIPGVERAISTTRFSPDGKFVACGSWDGLVSVLGASDLICKSRIRDSHTEKVGTLDWDHTSDTYRLVTGGGEGSINIWDYEDTTSTLKPHVTIKQAHSHRITKTLFHPHGKHIASTSFDRTWKFWDISRPDQELYQQEGHSAEVFSGAFHPDGSLFALGGLDAVARVWDLRSGRSISTLQKHIKGIYSMDWAPNGYHLATASGDNSVKIWDLRMLEKNNDELFTIPAHTKLVSEVRFFSRTGVESLSEPVTDEHDEIPEVLDSNGTFLVTASYDGHLKIWLADNWVLVRTLGGGTDKFMSCDINGCGDRLVSGGWDRSVKLWGLEQDI